MVTMDYPANADARMLATASKRKLQRVRGAILALDKLDPECDYTAQLIAAEEAVTRTHSDLTGLLEQADGGDLFKRTRAEWLEAMGMTAYVRRSVSHRAYLPTVEAEEAAALHSWEAVQQARSQLRDQKAALAKEQGAFYALLELGFLPSPEYYKEAIAQQRETWQAEEDKTKMLFDTQEAALERRRTERDAWHKLQGELKAEERFGETSGALDPPALRALRLSIMERDAQHLRATSKATLRALEHAKEAHTQTKWELHCSTGAISFLSQLSAQAHGAAQQHAEEYEASLEVGVLRSTLDALAPRAAAALHVRLGWHAAVGAHEVAKTLGAPTLPELARQLADAQAAANAGEPVRREQSVLEAKLAKLEGKLHVLAALKGVQDSNVAGAMYRELRTARLTNLRLTMKAADLGLGMIKYEKAQANSHAAGGALVCLKRLQTSAIELPSLVAAPRGGGAPPAAGGGGVLTAEMRSFIRGEFGPLLRAATQQLLLRRPAEPFAFLAEWLFSHSDAGGHASVPLSASEADVTVRRQELHAAHAALARTLRSIATGLPPAEQAASASLMLAHLLAHLPQREVVFDELEARDGDAGAGAGAGALATASTSVRSRRSAARTDANAQLLDSLAAVLLQHPAVLLRVTVTVAAPADTNAVAVANAVAGGQPASPQQQLAQLAELSRRRELAIVEALRERGVPEGRAVSAAAEAAASGLGGAAFALPAAAASADGGSTLQPTSSQQLEIFAQQADSSQPLPSALAPGGKAAAASVEAERAAAQKMTERAAAAKALAERRAEQLAAIQAEYQALHAHTASHHAVQLARTVAFRVSVQDVRLTSHAAAAAAAAAAPSAAAASSTSSAQQGGETGAGGGGFALCIGFGMRREFGASAEFEASDFAVDEVDVEVWDATRSALLGQCVLDVAPLLRLGGGAGGAGATSADDGAAPAQPEVKAELVVLGPGGAQVATLKAAAATSR